MTTDQTRTIALDEWRDRLEDPSLTLLDVRPLAAYNGWRLGTEARPLRDNEIPPSLAPWVPWVLFEERDRECPFIYNQPAARRCAWPSRASDTPARHG